MAPAVRISACLMVVACACNYVSSGDWPMFGRDFTRNAVSPEKNPPRWWRVGDKPGEHRNIKWVASLGSHTKGSPVVAGGLVWVGTNNGRPGDPKVKEPGTALMCFREKDGLFHYKYVTAGPKDLHWESRWTGHTSSPLIEGDRMWFTTMWGEVVCLDIGPLRRGTGMPREVWKVDLRRELGVVLASETMGFARSCSIGPSYKGLIHVLTARGWDDEGRVASPKAPSLVCFRKDTGKIVWKDHSPAGNKFRDGEWASPLVVEIEGRGQVITPQGDGWVRSFDALSGTLLWIFDTNPGDVTWVPWLGTANGLLAAPVYDGRHVYIGNGNNPNHAQHPAWLYCIDPTKRGDISPERKDAEGRSRPNPDSGMVWRYGGRDERKRRRLAGLYSSVVVRDGLVIAADVDEYLHCLDARTGRLHWRYDSKGMFFGSPLIVDDILYAQSDIDMIMLACDKELRLLRVIELPDNS